MRIKINRIVSFLFVGIFLLSFSSCKKKPFNYRNKYLGDWEFTVDVYEWNMTDGVTAEYTTSFDGDIAYGDENDRVDIHFLQNVTLDPICSKGGVFSGINRFDGEFDSKKEVHFSYEWGGNGGGGSYTVSGEKK